jgi:hypothetical protein
MCWRPFLFLWRGHRRAGVRGWRSALLNVQYGRMSRRSSCTPKRRTAFLAAIAQGTRRAAYNWRETDEAFKQAWIEAQDMSTDLLEQKLFEMAREGDVTALIFMLRSRKAAVYNPNLSSGSRCCNWRWRRPGPKQA